MSMFTTPVKTINTNFDIKSLERQLRNNLFSAKRMGIESRGDYYYKVNFDFAEISNELLEYTKPFLVELGMEEDLDIDMWGNF